MIEQIRTNPPEPVATFNKGDIQTADQLAVAITLLANDYTQNTGHLVNNITIEAQQLPENSGVNYAVSV